MTNQIHKTAIIEDGAVIGRNNSIGAYSIIGKNVILGDNNTIKSHVVIEGNTTIGNDNIIFQFSSIGADPQDLKFSGEESRTIIGDNNKIREFVTINSGTKDGIMETRVGSNCLFMAYCHIAHDCIVDDNVILANCATLAGHVEVGKGAVIGGLSAIHQFVRIGNNAMIGGMSGVEEDVIPYGTVKGERANLAGLNLIGLKRSGASKDSINKLRHFYKDLFLKSSNFNETLKSLEKEFGNDELTSDVIGFLKQKSSRSFCQPKKQS
jgi:UDP-N-acetylglucosamine acyltransferase